jgi:hypothetical protein
VWADFRPMSAQSVTSRRPRANATSGLHSSPRASDGGRTCCGPLSQRSDQGRAIRLSTVRNFRRDADLIPANSRGDLILEGRCEFPAPCQRNGYYGAGRRQKMSYRKPFHASDTPPHRASDRDRSEENGQEYCEATRSHPIRQGDLGGRIKARDDKRPRHSGNETCAESDYGIAREPQQNEPERGGE